jgi:hypothetical protein
MPRRYYCRLLILIVVSCSVFTRRSDFEKGMLCYTQSQFADAARYFEIHYAKSPASDTVLYYLYNCYTQLDAPDRAVQVLERLVDLGSATTDVINILFTYYRTHAKYHDLYTLLSTGDLSYDDIPGHIHMTRRLYAELLFGAHTRSLSSKSDPVAFAISENLIPPFPNGEFYADDSLTYGHLIILLDRLVKPQYPAEFKSMKHVPNTSYLYLPYMRLVELGLIDYDPELQPAESVPVAYAVSCIERMKRQGLID